MTDEKKAKPSTPKIPGTMKDSEFANKWSQRLVLSETDKQELQSDIQKLKKWIQIIEMYRMKTWIEVYMSRL